MNKFLTGTLAIGLLLTTAACGSDEKSSDTTTAAAETVASSDVSTADTTAYTSADTATDETASAETVATAGGTLQEQVLAQTITQLAGLGYEYDESCLSEQISKLSDEDAQLIVDAGIEGTPDVSADGEAIGTALQDCVTLPVTATT